MVFTLALVGAMLSPVSLGVVEKASAATVPIGAIQANVSNHHGTDGGTDSSNCVKYSPTGGSASSAFVGAGGEALTSHGYSGSCPTLAVDQQPERGRGVAGRAPPRCRTAFRSCSPA